MDEKLSVDGEYQIIFTGLPVYGVDIKQVREKFSEKFGLPAGQLGIIFSGGPVILQKNLGWTSAMAYVAAMKEMGALCEISRGQETTVNQTGLSPCPECKSLQAGNICRACGFDLKTYRAQMAAKGFVQIASTGYIKNRREAARRLAADRRDDVRYEEKRRIGIDRRMASNAWYSA